MMDRPDERCVRSRAVMAGAAAIVAAGALVAGCNVLGPAAYLAFGEPPIEAEYELQDRATVVYVDDRANVIGRDGVSVNARSMRISIADKISEDLMVNKVLLQENTISPRDAFGIVSARDRHGDLLPIDAIGRLVGADQIIYVEMLRFTLLPDGVTPRPTADCRVRVIDVENRLRLFPSPDETQEVSRAVGTRMLEVDPARYQTTAAAREVYLRLAQETGEQIARLFYRHDSLNLGGRLEPR